MQQVDLVTSLTKLNENCGLPDFFTDYQIRHLGNPFGLPEILLKIDPCSSPEVPAQLPILCVYLMGSNGSSAYQCHSASRGKLL